MPIPSLQHECTDSSKGMHTRQQDPGCGPEGAEDWQAIVGHQSLALGLQQMTRKSQETTQWGEGQFALRALTGELAPCPGVWGRAAEGTAALDCSQSRLTALASSPSLRSHSTPDSDPLLGL